MTVALLGPDGSGKSTLAAVRQDRSPASVRVLHMGLWSDHYLAAFRRLPWLGVLLRSLAAWRLYLIGRFHRACGRIVVFDR